MDWTSLLIGAVVGGGVGVMMQNILYPKLERQWRARRHAHAYRRSNQAWARIERLHPRLVLVQAGWDQHGCFAEGTVTLRLGQPFVLDDPEVKRLRDRHSPGWVERGFIDGEQIGIAAIAVGRTSDDPEIELEGRAHALNLTTHRYRFFDFLATHILRLQGTETERLHLNSIAEKSVPDGPVRGFPTPCSVGLSVFCESGNILLLVRRAARAAAGYWEPGQIFNAVGENAAPRDFISPNMRAHDSSPEVVARRGLYEELGISATDVSAGTLRLHSFTWATDLLDYKFFGYFQTPLSQAEVQDRWRAAPDRSETAGHEFFAWPVGTRAECRELLNALTDESSQWAPEAVFATLRSLIVLHKVSAADINKYLRTHGHL